jgi:predicted porin
MKRAAKHLLSVGSIALVLAAGLSGARADDVSEAILKRLDALEKENGKLRAEIKRIEAKTTAPAKPASEVGGSPEALSSKAASTSSANSAGASSSYMVQTAGTGYIASPDGGYFQKKPGDSLTFRTPNGEITAYGNLDVSLDVTTKGISKFGTPGDHPIGNLGWMPALSTNLSYLGVRGFQNLGDQPFKFVYQLETQLDITAASGVSESNSNFSNVVKSGLTSRNSFIGLASDSWGAIKVGKSDAPYKNSTAMMNPFSGMLGDYSVIMGNTGGDNRVEFGTRLDHSIWYESPTLGGFKLAALYSPGQNRASNSDNIAAGESDCAGGNSPVSGGFNSCADGSFSDVVSASLTYTNGPFLLTGAYERHEKVNRSSDIDPAGPFGPFAALDVAAEDAAKIGMQIMLPTKTTISGIFESMHRYVNASLAGQNERQRNGTWLAVTQQLTEKDSLSFGWAHAFATPGDPGQHNTSGGPDPDNSANLLTVAYKHTFVPGLMVYADWAGTFNAKDAHFDLGAGGRGVTTDCHDASDAAGGATSSPHCWAGGTLLGFSVGMKYQF